MNDGTRALAALATAAILLFAAPRGHAQAPTAPTGTTASATLRADQPGPVVNKNIYGHFAEHLGRGIYEGIWVGPNSPIPNTHNTFAATNSVQPAAFSGATVKGDMLEVQLPAKSVVVLALR